MATAGDNLSGALELLWAAERAPGRETRPGLSITRIVATAIDLADRGGIGAVTMARIAQELGFTTMSLYRHVPSKDDLLVLMVDAASAEPPDVSTAADWRAGLEQWAWSQLADLRRHPWVLDIPVTGPPMTPKSLAWMDSALQAMSETGLEDGEKVANLLLLTGYVLNAARFAVEMPQVNVTSATEEPGATYGALLARVIDAARFPALSRAVESGVFDDTDTGFTDDDFDFGLQRVLDGVGVLISARASR